MVAAAWCFGVAAGWGGWVEALTSAAAGRLDPPLPSVAELAARLPPGDVRPALYAAGVALGEERRRAEAAPRPLDPNAADRAEWDRLPGIGPRIAETIVEHRSRHGPFAGPADLLAVRGIGPVRLDRISPWLAWPSGAAVGNAARARSGSPATPDLNDVDESFLDSLPGIGPKLATSVVAERRRRRGFRDWAEVLAIKGIGEAKLRVLQDATRLADPPPGAPTPRPAHEGNR
ncbi:MAG TPA: helix-hairpin-helix domain-containing protein [Gemmatimonadota bacterium]|nr:helix-hairpin-helix domain-containing protein [Gemmatimonadota bacterium]